MDMGLLTNKNKKTSTMRMEEHKRLICRMNEVQPSDKAAILVVMDCGGDIRIGTFGDNDDIEYLRAHALTKLYTMENGKEVGR